MAQWPVQACSIQQRSLNATVGIHHIRHLVSQTEY